MILNLFSTFFRWFGIISVLLYQNLYNYNDFELVCISFQHQISSSTLIYQLFPLFQGRLPDVEASLLPAPDIALTDVGRRFPTLFQPSKIQVVNRMVNVIDLVPQQFRHADTIYLTNNYSILMKHLTIIRI